MIRGKETCNTESEMPDPRDKLKAEMPSIVRQAIDRAIENFGDCEPDGMFNAAGFGIEFNKLCGISGGIDGIYVDAILSSREDIENLPGGAHYRFRPHRPSDSRLFVIRKVGQAQYWTCSPEHGSGWNVLHPKQAFSKSELSKEIFRLIDLGWFCPIEIIELKIPV